MTENAIYDVWLQQSLGEGNRKAPLLIDYFGSSRAVYDADEHERKLSGILVPKELARLSDTPLDMAAEILEACKRLGYNVITCEDENYPDRLRNIPDYPLALYILGKFPDIDDEVCIAMVGTRRATRYGYTTATAIAKDLAACGAIVVSGCARGIDTAAHQGSLLSGGKTLAVLGCGINTPYNMENEGLRKVISTSGALISEYPPGSPPLGYHFPVRNRIISALSLGVIVVEAGAKSGSLITANIALEQGKDIFSVPGEISSYQAKGTNRLIFDGAIPIEKAGDVLEMYVQKFPHRLKSNNLQDKNSRVYEKHVRPKWDKEALAAENAAHVPKAPEAGNVSSAKPQKATPKQTADRLPEPAETAPPIGMSESAQKVWKALTAAPKHFQDLLAELNMDSAELSRSITELELYASIRTLPGNKYSRG